MEIFLLYNFFILIVLYKNMKIIADLYYFIVSKNKIYARQWKFSPNVVYFETQGLRVFAADPMTTYKHLVYMTS